MKTKHFLIVITIFVVCSCKANPSESAKNQAIISHSQESFLKDIQQSDTLLNNIERKISIAFAKANITQTDNELVLIEQDLLRINEKKKNSIIVYWYSYTCYYHSIFSLIQKDLKTSEKILDEGIDKLDEVDSKSSEHFALLALMESFSIQFSAGIKAPFISSSVKKNAEKALALDSLNLRAYYVLGSNDFYTPEQYGGGKKAENYFKKAIQLSDQSVKNKYLPSWGKNSAYELLIRLYIKQKRFDEAKKQFQDAIGRFPNDYMINQLAAKLINATN